MNNTYVKALSFLLIAFLLSGCLYPKNELAQNQIPNEEQLKTVQSAVEQYMDMTNGLAPIKTKPADTPIFEKYLIDFTALKENGVLAEIPGNAYENGGYYQYVLITPEDNPRVKLLDLRITEAIRQVNVKLNLYRNKNLYPPFGNEIEKGIYQVNYEKLGIDEPPHVVSPLSRNNLQIIMDTDGQLYVDYRIDLQQALEEFDHQYQHGEDIRMLLAENTPFVPAYSLPYTISEDGEVQFILN